MLLILSIITVPLFLFTRSMAARNRAVNLDVARVWFEKGQKELSEGQIAAATDSFRKAATNNHGDPRYVLALASTLVASGKIEEAKQILLQLRLSSPESGEINLQLARLSQVQGLTNEAIRYYHNALYGVWPEQQIVDRRRSVRMELIHVLLDSGDTEQSLSELLILSSDIADTEMGHNEVGRLFLEAGDWRRALEQFDKTLRLNKQSGEALDGAGRALFNLADYRKASEYLSNAIASGRQNSETRELLDVAESVLSGDPLAPHLPREERIKRLVADLDVVRETLQRCMSQVQDGREALPLQNLATELERDRKNRYTPQKLRADADEFRAALSLIYRVERSAEEICHESSPLGRALVLIAQRNGAVEQ